MWPYRYGWRAHLGAVKEGQHPRAIGGAVALGKHLIGGDQRRARCADRHRDHQHHHGEQERHTPAQLPNTIHVAIPQ
jgi:hypothetical protein